MNKKFEQIEFETDICKYVLNAPIDPPYTTIVGISRLNKNSKLQTDHWLALSTDMLQVAQLFRDLRKSDKFVIRAVDWCVEESIMHEKAVHALCYDFASQCPYVEVTYQEWAYDINKERVEKDES